MVLQEIHNVVFKGVATEALSEKVERYEFGDRDSDDEALIYDPYVECVDVFWFFVCENYGFAG